MARLQGISGGMSGKTGSFVFRQNGGQTIVSQYQPIVKNPNSEGQQAQRAKFKLMSQLAAIMSPSFGSFIIKTKAEKGTPTQRNAFVQLNMPLVEVSSDNQQVTAHIAIEDIKLTSSFVELGTTLTVVLDEGDVSASVLDVPTNVEFVQFCLVKSEAGQAPRLLGIQRAKRTSETQTTFTTAFEQVGDGDYAVLAFGLIPSDSSVTSKLNNIFTPTTSQSVAAVTLNTLVTSGSLSVTKTLGAKAAV